MESSQKWREEVASSSEPALLNSHAGRSHSLFKLTKEVGSAWRPLGVAKNVGFGGKQPLVLMLDLPIFIAELGLVA